MRQTDCPKQLKYFDKAFESLWGALTIPEIMGRIGMPVFCFLRSPLILGILG